MKKQQQQQQLCNLQADAAVSGAPVRLQLGFSCNVSEGGLGWKSRVTGKLGTPPLPSLPQAHKISLSLPLTPAPCVSLPAKTFTPKVGMYHLHITPTHPLITSSSPPISTSSRHPPITPVTTAAGPWCRSNEEAAAESREQKQLLCKLMKAISGVEWEKAAVRFLLLLLLQRLICRWESRVTDAVRTRR